MAHVKIVKNYKGLYVKFRLLNKPEFICKMDCDDFYNIVHGTNYWYIHSTSKPNCKRYYIRRNDGKGGHIHLHRVVSGAPAYDPKTCVVDHLNNDSLDNRKINLSITTQQNNARNPNNRVRVYINEKVEPFMGCNICIVTKYDWKYYQAYHGKKYMGCRKNLDDLKTLISNKMGEK